MHIAPLANFPSVVLANSSDNWRYEINNKQLPITIICILVSTIANQTKLQINRENNTLAYGATNKIIIIIFSGA